MISALQALPVSYILYSVSGSKNFFSNLLRLNSTINSDNYNFERLILLFAAILNNKQDKKIWDKVYVIATESTFSISQFLPFLSRTLYLYTTSSLVNFSECRKYVDYVLKKELDLIYIDIPGFFEVYFGGIDRLDNICTTVFEKYKKGDVLFQRKK